MKKYLFALLMLCLFMYACEQESITSELTSHEITDRSEFCDLKEIPLYIPPITSVQGNIDFSTAFAVTESTDYESANNVNVAVQNISYSVNETPTGSSFAHQNNTNYNLRISATYYNGAAWITDEFSIKFKVNNGQLVWESRSSCLYDDDRSNEINSRTIQSVIIAD